MGMICSYTDTKGDNLFSYILMVSPFNFIDSSLAEFINASYICLAYLVFCYNRFSTNANVYSVIFDCSTELKLNLNDGQRGIRRKLFILINEDAIFNILKILYKITFFQLIFYRSSLFVF